MVLAVLWTVLGVDDIFMFAYFQKHYVFIFFPFSFYFNNYIWEHVMPIKCYMDVICHLSHAVEMELLSSGGFSQD